MEKFIYQMKDEKTEPASECKNQIGKKRKEPGCFFHVQIKIRSIFYAPVGGDIHLWLRLFLMDHSSFLRTCRRYLVALQKQSTMRACTRAVTYQVASEVHSPGRRQPGLPLVPSSPGRLWSVVGPAAAVGQAAFPPPAWQTGDNRLSPCHRQLDLWWYCFLYLDSCASDLNSLLRLLAVAAWS